MSEQSFSMSSGQPMHGTAPEGSAAGDCGRNAMKCGVNSGEQFLESLGDQIKLVKKRNNWG